MSSIVRSSRPRELLHFLKLILNATCICLMVRGDANHVPKGQSVTPENKPV